VTKHPDHEPRYVCEGGGMIDVYQCSCGWESKPYFDGDIYAFMEWEKHVKSALRSKDGQ
jgi:hypothetical protein